MDEKHSENGLWQRLTDWAQSPLCQIYLGIRSRRLINALWHGESKSGEEYDDLAGALIGIGKGAVPALLEELKNGDETARHGATGTLVAIAQNIPDGEVKKRIVAALVEALEDGVAWLRGEAAKGLGNIGDASAASALLGLLGDPDWHGRYGAAMALGKMGDASAVLALAGLLKDSERMVRNQAAVALGDIRDGSAFPALLERLKDGDAEMQKLAAEALGKAIAHSSVEQLDKIRAGIIEAVEKAENAPTYKEMKKAAAPLLVAINTRRNQLLTVEIHIDPAMVLKRPKPPRGSGGMHRAFAGVS